MRKRKESSKKIEGLSDQRLMKRLKELKCKQNDAMTAFQEAKRSMPAKPLPGTSVKNKNQVTIGITKEIYKEICLATGIPKMELASLIHAQVMMMQAQTCSWLVDGIDLFKRSIAAISEIKPSNAIEAMLGVQMIAVHETAVKFLMEAAMPNQTFEGKDANVLRATRLLRVFNEQLEAMAKLKGKTGQQKVTVEHVHVNAGGQAIVGEVTAGKRRNQGEGGNEKS